MKHTIETHPKLVVLISLLCLSLFATSCVRFPTMVYMQEDALPAEEYITHPIKEYANEPLRDYRVKANDNLVINVSNYEGNSYQLFNAETAGNSALSGGGNSPTAAIYLNSYTITKKGTINLPLVGEMMVAGKTTMEIKAELDSLLIPHLKLVSSSVKLANFRLTILGEVNIPGQHYIYNDYVTLYEALGIAGDLTEYGNRERLKIVRETENGVKTAYLNLTSSELMSSEYYYLQPNDMIYVEPVKAWAFRTNANTASIVISAVSVVTLIANVIVTSRQP
ncbi:MAG: polysaccharide biosynthesis/export family protein [Bacteroidota bacterium]